MLQGFQNIVTAIKDWANGKFQPSGNYALVDNAGYSLGLNIDSDYIMTLELKNASGNVLSTKSIDFPIESMVVNASYADGELTLTLQNGQTLTVDISSIVNGLVNDSFTIAGIDMKDAITKEELASALGVPTKLSELANDSGYITDAGVTKVNGQTGDVNLTAEDVGALSLKKGGTVNNTFIVNKTSSTFPTNLKEIIVDSDGKVGFLGAINGVNNTLLHLDRSSTNSQITMKNATRLILPRNVDGPPSVTLNIKGAGGGVHLEHNSHAVNPNVGLWVTETGVVINSVDGLMDISEKNHNFTAASFNQSNHRIRLYTPDINIGPDGDFFIQAYFGNDSVSNLMYKNIKIRGALDSSITMEGINDPKTIFGQRNGKFVFRNFDYISRDADLNETAGYHDAIAVLNEDGTLVLFTDFDGENISYDVKLSGYEGLIFGNHSNYTAYNSDNIMFHIIVNGTVRLAKINMYIQNGDTFQFFPSGTSLVPTKNLGNSSYKWTNIYATNGTIQTSDRNEKNTIEELTNEKAQQLIYGLKPSTYQMNEGTSGRTHWGMISQDIEELLEELGWTSLDFAGFIKSQKEVIITEDENGKPLREPITQTIEGEYNYSLRYDEFIAPLIKTVQAQHEEIETLKQEMTLLKQQMQDLLNREV